MNSQLKAFQLSIAIHILIFLVVFALSNLVNTSNSPLTIDLSIENSVGKTAGNMPKEAEMKRPAPVIRNEMQKEIPQYETMPLPPAISETQVPVNAPMPDKSAYVEAKSENRDISLRNSTGIAETNITNTGTGENSEEKIKVGYIREHFTYIRDIIMKNLSYPQIARKMGWTGKVKISFIVCSNGHAKDIKITEGSGIEMLDKNAVEAVKRASPFPKPPLEAQIIIPIVYKLN